MSEVPPRQERSVELGEDAVSCVGIAAFDRPDEPSFTALGARASDVGAVRRHGGGRAVWLGPGILRVAFRFPMDGTVTPDGERLLNRAVRPVLRALRSVTPLAHYFGRDVVSVKLGGKRHDVGAVAFAHDAGAERGIFEAFLGVDRAPRADLVPLSTLVPGLTVATLVQALRDSFAAEGATATGLAQLPSVTAGPTWDVVHHTPFARIGATASPPSVGGDFFVSSDFLGPLNTTLQGLDGSASPSQIRAAFAEGPRDGQVLVGIPGTRELAEPLIAAFAAARRH